MTLHAPSIRAAAVLLVNAVAALAEAVLERADAVVCRWAQETGGEEDE